MDNRLMNDMNYEISIIMPLYNMGYIIEETFLSLTKQTDKRFNVIIVDDGSTDDGADIINRWQKKGDLSIDYIYQDNAGVSQARNNGIDHCKTPYIIFCDADDILPYYTVELAYKHIKQYDVIAGRSSRRLEDAGSKLENIIGFDSIDLLEKEFLYNNSSMHFCGFVYKRDIINKNGLRFSRDLKYGEDEEFTWKYLCHCKTAKFLDLILYCYRPNPKSAVNNLTFARTQVIDSMIRVSDYYYKENQGFADQLKKYGIPRAKLAILKQFAENRRKDLFDELVESKMYKAYRIKSLLRFPNTKIKIASFIFCLSPSLFYRLLGRYSV